MKRSFMFLFVLLVVPAMFVMGCGSDKLTPDTTAPLAPVLMGASGSDTGLGLWWEPNTEPDLSGYLVYVRQNGVSRLASPGTITETFITVTLKDDGQAFVYVTAIDLSGNESSPSASQNISDLSDPGRVNFPGDPNQK